MEKAHTITVVGLYGMSVFMQVGDFPSVGETVNGDGMIIEPGGKGFNQAVCASRLGAKVNFITAVGRDLYGQALSDYLKKESINSDGIVYLDDEPTAVGVVITDSLAKNKVVVYAGACNVMNKSHIKQMEKKIINSHVLLVQHELPMVIIKEAIEIANNNNVKVILNPAPAKRLSEEILKKVSVITPNWGEALSITDMDSTTNPCDVAQELSIMGARNVIITLGAHGSYSRFENGSCYSRKAYKVKAVDTTGAGDVFNGALAYYMLSGKCEKEAVDFASAASAISVSKRAVVEGVPGINQIKQFLQERQENCYELA